MKEELRQVYCDRMSKLVPIRVSRDKGIVSVCCCYEEGGRDCQHRAELGCALYERFSSRGNPIVEDIASVLGRRARVVYEAARILIAAGVSFVIGGRDVVNAYCPGTVKETVRTNFFIKSVDRDAAWRALRKRRFRIKPLDPTYCIAGMRDVSIELHYGRPPRVPEYVDENTLARAIKIRLIDIDVALQPIEELVAYKAHRYLDRDRTDLSRLLDEWGEEIDVKYLRKVARDRNLSIKKLAITERGVKLKHP